MSDADKPSSAAVMERAFSLVNEAMFTVELQRRRVRSEEPEDSRFPARWWADVQFLIVALRRAAELASGVPENARRSLCRIKGIRYGVAKAFNDAQRRRTHIRLFAGQRSETVQAHTTAGAPSGGVGRNHLRMAW